MDEKKNLFGWEEKLEGRKLNLYKFNIISLLNKKKVTRYIFIKKNSVWSNGNFIYLFLNIVVHKIQKRKTFFY